MSKRMLGSLCLAGAALVAGAGLTPRMGAHAAASMVKISNPGYTLTVPSTWKYDNAIPTAQLFKDASLQHLTSKSAIFITADQTDAVAAVVLNGTASTAAIKSLDTKIIKDDTKLLSAITYQTVSQHGASFLIGGARVSSHGKTMGEAVATASRGGKTYYFLAAVQIGSSAKLKADANEVTAVLDSITLR